MARRRKSYSLALQSSAKEMLPSPNLPSVDSLVKMQTSSERPMEFGYPGSLGNHAGSRETLPEPPTLGSKSS